MMDNLKNLQRKSNIDSTLMDTQKINLETFRRYIRLVTPLYRTNIISR